MPKENTENNEKFGYFDDLNYEYVITTPYTPTPWINYLGNDGFYGLISNTAGGYCFDRDPKFRRLTRYRYNSVPLDNGGRYFYIGCNGEYWSATGRPVNTELDEYTCRHGMGYSRFNASKNNIATEVTSFIPLNTKAEVHRLIVTNNNDTEQSVDVFSFIEWCLWNAEDDGANYQRNLSTGEVEVEDSTIYHKTEYRERRNHYAFYSVNRELDGFETDRESFLGPYRGFDRPLAVEKGQASNSIARGWSPIASHHLKLQLAPGESQSLVFTLGYCEVEPEQKWAAPNIINKTPAQVLSARFDCDEKVSAELKKLNDYWHNLLGKFQVQTPDDKFNRAVNIWNQYQNMVTFNLSRSASFYESGIGRGMGFRDSNQDTIGFAHMVPEKVKERILDLSATQKEDGSAYHQYQPLTKKGNADIGGNFNDDPMWMVLSTANYIKETGDFSILDEVVPFDSDPNNTASHFTHLERSFNHVVNNLGPHGLPLIGRADWNDCLNLNCFSENPNESYQTTQRGASDVAESVMIAGQFVLYGQEFVDLCINIGKADLAKSCQSEVDKMRQTIKQHAWDGEWFLRAYDANGDKIGSNDNAEGKIFIESQGFCVMAGVGFDDGKALQAMNSVEKHLSTDFGIMLNQPAFTGYNKYIGEITSYPPGYKENAGIFCHNNPWITISEAMLGRGEKAYEYYSKITPAFLQDVHQLHKTEPYVYSQMIAGADSATPGEAKNSWLTGTAAWNYYAATQYILGIRPEYQGLRIDPCILPSWDKVSVSRTFRGATYKIELRNPLGLSKGVIQLEIDGQKIAGDMIDPTVFANQHNVIATLCNKD
ncbi:GH36-type glycosyl hydrolase domain-containing protein [Paraglaciecola arctica]|uniref:Cellobiose phosphorylase n=1 Tax=Paraglaciecola arctica BSs20135 TaxID=493475 RepID=K6Z8N2_9ALTE|nr:cellobiose phosphorylase [Paraglaciecola arctica]GAC19785.1 cellobiose phosphorylase [Paraglaciecola arctica BSs20135]